MDDQFEIVPLDESAEAQRYIETRSMETGILEDLEHVWQEMIEETEDREGHESDLEIKLQKRYNEWQFGDGGEIGLSSGGVGEMFTRLIGTGIMTDMPEVFPIDENAPESGVHYIKKAQDRDDTGEIEITMVVGKKLEDRKVCKFRFATSIDKIDERISVLTSEIDQAGYKHDLAEAAR